MQYLIQFCFEYCMKNVECLPVKLPRFQDFNLLLALWDRNIYLAGLIGQANDLLHARDH